QFFIAAAHIAEHGHAGHALYTAGDYIVHIASSHGLSCEMQGLLTRTAHAIERYGRHLNRKSGCQYRQTGDVGALLSRLSDRTVDDVFDLGTGDPNALRQPLKSLSEQLIRRQVTKGPAAAGEGSADGFNKNGFGHRAFLRGSTNVLKKRRHPLFYHTRRTDRQNRKREWESVCL